MLVAPVHLLAPFRFFGTHKSQNSQKSNLADYRVPTSTAIVLQSYETSNIVEFNADNEV